jgi:hypothetical protein
VLSADNDGRIAHAAAWEKMNRHDFDARQSPTIEAAIGGR